ncbi:hypothetical protein NPIL_536761 [Nephila pilipes]|uniref:Uncharacterized protein n=1 Tax=Nephila pilipes TaxID=299642 RepID=A0A8X6MVV8_NEPPI|nr:hypothetical protein NPIL_536761 [Nephila pilipes]
MMVSTLSFKTSLGKNIYKEIGAAMKPLLFFVVIFSLTSPFLGLKYPEMRNDLFRKLFHFHSDSNSTQSPPDTNDPRLGKITQFCDILNCPCIRPPSARCCEGYLYDERSNECRYVY